MYVARPSSRWHTKKGHQLQALGIHSIDVAESNVLRGQQGLIDTQDVAADCLWFYEHTPKAETDLLLFLLTPGLTQIFISQLSVPRYAHSPSLLRDWQKGRASHDSF